MSVLCWLALAYHAHAAETLTWQAAVEQALKGNAEVQAAESTWRAARLEEKGSYSGYFPQLSGALSYQHGSTQLDSGDFSVDSDRYGATLTLSQNLFAGLKDQATVERAAASTAIMRARLEAARAKLGYDLKLAYSGLLFAERSTALQETIIKRRENNLRLVELRFKSGGENRGSVLLSQAYLEQARYDALQAKNGAEVASTQLARVLGRDEDVAFTLRDDIPFVEPTGPAPDFRQLAESVPAKGEASANVASARAELKNARAGFFPTLGLSATAGDTGERWFPDRDRWSVGATLTVPLFNGGRDYFASRAAGADLFAARATLDNVTRDTRASLKSAYAALVESARKLKVDESFRVAATKRAEIARVKYKNGLMTFEDWDLIESDLINREKAVLQSQRDRARAEAAWTQASGKGLALE